MCEGLSDIVTRFHLDLGCWEEYDQMFMNERNDFTLLL